MFILGLAVGPALGLFAAQGLARSSFVGPRLAVAILALVLFVFLVAGLLDLELKLGLVIGILSGLLLGSSPMEVDVPDRVT